MGSPEALRFASMLGALGHESRLEAVRLLLRAHPQGMVAGELQEELGIPASTLSHHLDALRREGLIEQVREGRYLRYAVATESLRELLGFLYAECCGGRCGAVIEIPLPAAAAARA
jgi:DNA-binding transcriptional ArsR family regulator